MLSILSISSDESITSSEILQPNERIRRRCPKGGIPEMPEDNLLIQSMKYKWMAALKLIG